MKRKPYRAGSFYEASERACRRAGEAVLARAELPDDLPAGIVGGLVPHAGWVFSGATAAVTLKALASQKRMGRVVIFGADHWGLAGGGCVYDSGAWETPLGDAAVDEELAAALLESVKPLVAEPAVHAREHSIEVQVPLMKMLNDRVRIVPISVPPAPEAVAIGRAVGEKLAADFPDAAVVGSTDLTHYGPQYGFTPGGVGPAGLEWAKDNDRRLLKLIELMRPEQVIEEAAARQNACGAGAVAATMAAAAAMGAARGVCLQYTTSAEVMARTNMGPADDAVGYAAVIFA